ncbi:MAG: (2Fe-2S) ferredoxin domain-containing protein [Bacteroidales bacterium]
MKEKKEKKYQIRICLGSACFSRGNRKVLGVIQNFLKDNKLEDITDFRGKQCLDLCSHGPVISINGQIYQEVSEENIEDTLKEVYQEELLLFE